MGAPSLSVRTACPVCGTAAPRPRYRCAYDTSPVADYLEEFYSHRIGTESGLLNAAPYELCDCPECGLVYQRAIPDEALMERLYEHWIAPEAGPEREGHECRARYAREILQVIEYFGKAPTPLRTLDFGMGWAEWALMAKALGCDSHGAELSLRRIDYARSIGITVVDTQDIPAYAFDFINVEQVLEHVAEPVTILRLLAAALVTGGMIRVSVPDGSTIEHRLAAMDWSAPRGSKRSLNPVAPLEHINCFRRSALLRAATEAGLRETALPLRVQYGYQTQPASLRTVAKETVRPVYRRLVKRADCVHLVRA